jgi:flavin-dependent dehydrogenase
VLLCGDAAGFINSITGEGIYYAMVSGEIAAGVAAEALEADDTSEQSLSRYQTRWKNDFGKDLKILGRFNRQWGKKSEKIVRLLSKDEKLAKLIVGVTGGQLSISKYRIKLLLRYIYVSLKDLFSKNEKN